MFSCFGIWPAKVECQVMDIVGLVRQVLRLRCFLLLLRFILLHYPPFHVFIITSFFFLQFWQLHTEVQ